MVKNIVKTSVNRYATHHFAVSQIAGQWLFGKKKFNDGSVKVWPNAIDCAKFRYNPETRKRKRLELRLNDAFTLVHVGRLSIPKNHLFLIDIFDELAKQIPNSKLLLVGDDQMNGLCQKHASQKKSCDNILFLGGRSDIAELLMAGDVFVFPSIYEGFGIAPLEAQAAGLHCVISDATPVEVCLTDNIMQLPINKGTDIWVNKILELKDKAKTKTDNYDTLVEKGYDIHALCQKLTEFYKNSVFNRD
jgi:glycosyltransferase involved in cell wall biosynthesis